MYQGPTEATSAVESGGNLERIYDTVSRSQAELLKQILIELRVHSAQLQEGLNTRDDPEALRTDVRNDPTLVTAEG